VKDCLSAILIFIIAMAFLFFIITSVNSCSSISWNDGICPKCEIRYELRGASQGLKYYSCPDCGNEVQRY
jgi:hypothetical protein